MVFSKESAPTILVIFGATGDLMRRKVLPALYHLHQKKLLPNHFKVVGVSRRNLSDSEFKKHVFNSLSNHYDVNTKKQKVLVKNFLDLFSYSSLSFENFKDYEKLDNVLKSVDEDWGLCANKLFFLAAIPSFYKIILKNLSKSKLTAACSEEMGWTRVIFEKPFGTDLVSAKELVSLLKKDFKEEQLFLIDHYLGKEMVQNILRFRFSNNFFEGLWNKQAVKRIEVRLNEKVGVENRSVFYDSLGALKDVGQNHLLQVLALITMNHPGVFDSKSIHEERLNVLKNLKKLTKFEVQNFTYRAQYKQYSELKGVKKGSKVETYFKIVTSLNLPKWSDVPIVLESGKALKTVNKEIVVFFKHPKKCFCAPGEEHYQNRVVFSLEPKEQIKIYFQAKKPGIDEGIEEKVLSYLYRDNRRRIPFVEEYEKLLIDAIKGDRTLFTTPKEVLHSWMFIQSISDHWNEGVSDLEFYEQNTSQPVNESQKIVDAFIRVDMKKEIGIIGLGKMGKGLALNLFEKGYKVVGMDFSKQARDDLRKQGVITVDNIKSLVSKLSPGRVIWVMVPSGSPVEDVLFSKQGLVHFLSKNDLVIDGGNSFYKNTIKRAERLEELGFNFLDVGVSGGPRGARFGACLMIGGKKGVYQSVKPLFKDLSVVDGHQFFKGSGAGHFVKMIHNGIEYGMMQAISEGFNVLKKSGFDLDLLKVSSVYNNGSVIESNLIGWLHNGLKVFGVDLKQVSGKVSHTGEGLWTVKTAKEMGLKTKIIEEALSFRISSQKKPDYTGKLLSTMRNQFGGHDIK